MRKIYYNEIDKFCAEWLKNLMREGYLPHGDIDTRSVLDVTPDDIKSYTQCHFFAGIGGWAYALALADFPADREVWTGSCPCQPFSAAGQGGGFADERHLWPYWYHLIAVQRPAMLFGEQVAAKAGLDWLDLVCADLEAADYATGVSDLGAAGVGAPHIRQRLWFVGISDSTRSQQGHGSGAANGYGGAAVAASNAAGFVAGAVPTGQPEGRPIARNGSLASSGATGALAIAESAKRFEQRPIKSRLQSGFADSGQLGNADDARSQGRRIDAGKHADQLSAGAASQFSFLEQPGCIGRQRYWSAAEWLPCTDGKARPVEPGTFPLAHGIPGRVGRLRAYGNAIVPQVAEQFIRAVMEHRP